MQYDRYLTTLCNSVSTLCDSVKLCIRQFHRVSQGLHGVSQFKMP